MHTEMQHYCNKIVFNQSLKLNFQNALEFFEEFINTAIQ